MPLGVVGKILMSRILMEYLFGNIWIQIAVDRQLFLIDFKLIFAAEFSNKFQKTRFSKEKSVEDVVTFEGLPFNSSMISFHIRLFKKSIHTLQNNVHMLSFPFFVMGSHLGQRHKAHYLLKP